MNLPLLSIRLQYERDVVTAHQRARQVAEALGFDTSHQTRLATAVSEIARNAVVYAGGGKAAFSLDGNTAPQLLRIVISDEGKGISNLEEILGGRYQSATGMGMGIIGAQRLMDHFRVDTAPGRGTTVSLGKLLPKRSGMITADKLKLVMESLERQKPKDLVDEFREQNRELLLTLEELRRRQDELTEVNRELEDTNRGVVALFAELDEKADSLRRADDMKSRFLSNMSHEFRTPLNSVLALSRLLLDHTDGDLTSEQELQVTFIRKSAESLSELVNDLLDLAKVEAGKIEIRPSGFDVAGLFGALRGMMRPLLISSTLNLVFDDAESIPELYSDEGKVSQVLRNFISNALKFTEAGEIRVRAEHDAATDEVVFAVTDTGIGIPPEHRETIFLEFAQLDSPIQRRVKGTGLGLPLSKRLAQLLGGDVSVASQAGNGSTFSLRIPRMFSVPEPVPVPSGDVDQGAFEKILLVEDDAQTRLLYEKYLRGTRWSIVAARSVREAEAVLRQLRPVAIVLDISLGSEDSWDFLARMKSPPDGESIPVVVATIVGDRAKAMALGADEYLEKPVAGELLRTVLQRLTEGRRSVLIVDDEEVSRYLSRQLFDSRRIHFTEARSGEQALTSARSGNPDLIVLDLGMPGMDGFATLAALDADEHLKGIPVIVATARELSPAERRLLEQRVLAVLPKATLLAPETGLRLESVLRAAGLEALAESAKRASA